MNEFSKNFLNEDWKAMRDAPRVFVSGFGKHPGWNDHMDEIGLITDSLIKAKAIIYDGIAQQVESAAWEKKGPDKIAPNFDHVIHWRRFNEALTGRMWSSVDGKGRSLYPMITLAHCVAQPFSWQAAEALPVLEEVGVKCRTAKTSYEVVTVLNGAQESLRSRVTDKAAPAPVSPSLGLKDWSAYFSRETVLLRRLLHDLKVNFTSFAPGSHAWCDGKKSQSRALRLPVIPGASPAESLNAWLSFLSTQLDPAVPLLGLLPVGRDWLDVIVGEPRETDFVVLRTLPAMTPLVTVIPYDLSTELSANETRVFADLARGEWPGISCFNGAAVESNREEAAKWLAKFRVNFFSRFLKPTVPPF